MKGIVLAGDSGNKLHPLTLGIPKQLLPIYDVPMIYHPIDLLIKSGIRDIMIITSVEHHAMFKENLGDGTKWGGSFCYACQTAPDGIAQAMDIAHDFIGKDSVCLITGDTIIVGDGFEKILDSLGVSVMLKAGFLTFMRNISERRNIKCVFIFLNCTSDYAVIRK